MITIDLQPYAIVENEGFQPPRTKIFIAFLEFAVRKHHIIPAMYAKVKDKQKVCLGKAKSISFITDNWTEPCTTKAFIGMSAHWVDTRWQRKSAILNCEQSSGRHTTERIAAKFEPVKYN